MSESGLKKNVRMLLLVALLLSLCLGCTGTKHTTKDPFFEKWSCKAKTSRGKSPVARGKTIKIPVETNGVGRNLWSKNKHQFSRALPRNRVTLKMRNTDIKDALRILARAANLNILMKSEIKGEISVDFNNVPWSEAFLCIIHSNMLTYIWEGKIIRIVTAGDLENDLKLESIQKEQREQQIMRDRLSPLLTMVVPIDYADPEKLKEDLQGLLTKDEKGVFYGSVRLNEHTSSLIIQATNGDLEKIVPMIEEIDKPTPQIRIEANIVETTKETARSLGIQWGGLYANTVNGNSYFITPGGSGGTAGTSPLNGSYNPASGVSGISGQGFGANFPSDPNIISAAGGVGSLGLIFGKVGGSILDLQLQALQNEGQLNILSSPSITTLDNQLAFTENGEKVPYVSIGSDGDREVKFEDAVLRLEITPHVIDGENLKMKIIVKKDEVDTSRTVDGNPFIIKKQTDTNLIVKNGETIVISGLSRERNSDGESGIPRLKDVPLLGYLFKGEDKNTKMEKVLIFITPYILDGESFVDEM